MKTVIIGCGRWGAGLARTLIQGGHEVAVVDKDPSSFARLGPAFRGRAVEGSGTDRRVLTEAGIERADALAAVTHADEVNIVAARVAKVFYHVPRVAARVIDPHKAEVYLRLGLPTVAPVSWGVNRLIELLRISDLETIGSLGNGEVDLMEAEIPARIAGRTVRDLTIPGEAAVVAISRGGKTFLPTAGAPLAEGDRIHLAVHGLSAGKLRAMLEL